MRRWWSAFASKPRVPAGVAEVNRLRAQYAGLTDQDLRAAGRRDTGLFETIAVTAVVASRVLGLEMFDEQIQGALGLAGGRIVEMQTGEGKTLAAVPAIVHFARAGEGVHVLTANDYLARRDAAWMGGIYEWLGLSVSAVQQGMGTDERRAAYRADVTYATANEVGFDTLRDQLALFPSEQVHRPFATALVDEADSILIDEARIPLVIAGGANEGAALALRAEAAVRPLIAALHYQIEREGRDVGLTDAGIKEVESRLGCPNLFAAEEQALLAAVQDALHAHVLLARDVDYVVKDGAVLSVDELKGRIVHERRWPAGLQTAIEWKEGVARKPQGRILGSITLENLIALYPQVCGMTGTAATQASEFREIYGLDVEVIPTHRPVARIDHPDQLFPTLAAKEVAVANEIRQAHASGQPVLVGTGSVEESERLSRALVDLPHHVLNARNEEAEAAIVAQAGQPGAVTLSTNMAGRGVDIALGPGVAERGGLYVIGMQRHESRRIDHQLRGRAGRQGDPGCSRFFVSKEDRLLARYAVDEEDAADLDRLQRASEGQSLAIRLFLEKYEAVIEGQRQALQRRRQAVLTGAEPCDSERERLATLGVIDDLWSDYLAAVQELRAGTIWISLGHLEPLHDYLTRVHAMYLELEGAIAEEVARRLEDASGAALDPRQRGATWTYLTTDQPFGKMSHRILRGVVQKMRRSFGRG